MSEKLPERWNYAAVPPVSSDVENGSKRIHDPLLLRALNEDDLETEENNRDKAVVPATRTGRTLDDIRSCFNAYYFFLTLLITLVIVEIAVSAALPKSPSRTIVVVYFALLIAGTLLYVCSYHCEP